VGFSARAGGAGGRYHPTVHSPTPAPETLLRRSGLRRTPVRVGVMEVLTRGRRPMSVPQILGKLRGAADTVTVYRTLNTFARKRLVHRVRGEDRSWLYALSDAAVDSPRPEHLHPHFVCDGCGKVECLGGARIPPSLVASLGVSPGYDVSYPEVVLHGTCPKCHV
jgi:Fur family transcriptional regulator, ferric uptake regulator